MSKYRPFPQVELPDRTWPDKVITTAPTWCSVDLRDGNQALATPMGVHQKIEMFRLLVDMGFKEIEVGFPSASQIDFDFVRKLVDDNMIPDDVSIQVLTQAREHLIRRTFESIHGTKRAIVHLYNSTSPLQRKVTFNLSRDEIKSIAIKGAEIVRDLVSSVPDTEVVFQYSPESFSDTEPEYALEVVEAVLDVWQPTPENKTVINLPATVEWATPNVYADQIEWFCRNVSRRESIQVSLHTHNDRGTGVAATELGLMAGADRVEGTLFGNGERTGNLDIVTVALNLFSQGVDPKLKVFDVPYLRMQYERLTQMDVHSRHPYAGDLVFTAFSGSHQDAIKKGMDRVTSQSDTDARWEVPYLTIDPRDIGRTYEAIIRINSQSGKGGVAYILSREFGIDIPRPMQPDLGHAVNKRADSLGRELSAAEIYDLFTEAYLNKSEPLEIQQFRILTSEALNHDINCEAVINYRGEIHTLPGNGKGPIDAFAAAIKDMPWPKFRLVNFMEQSIGSGSDADAAAFVQIETESGKTVWGAGVDSDINMAGLLAMVSAYNRSFVTSGAAIPVE